MNHTPLHTLLLQHSAHFDTLPTPQGDSSFQTPLHYNNDPSSELHTLLNGCALIDSTHRSLLRIEGNDRLTWLHGLCTQDIKTLQPGQGTYACHIDIKSRILTDMRIHALSDALLLDMEADQSRRFRRAFKRFVVMEHVKIKDASKSLAILTLAGPLAAPLLDSLLPIPASTLQTHHILSTTLFDIPCFLTPTDLFGPPAIHIIHPKEHSHTIAQHLLDSPTHTPSLVGHQACEHARILHGIPRLGPDLNDSVLFNEALLPHAVSFTKGCYLGQEIVERVDARGRLGRKLRGLSIPTSTPIPTGTPIHNDARKLGTVSSSIFLPQHNLSIALALLHRANHEPGDAVFALLEDGSKHTATVLDRADMTPSLTNTP